jgi:solute carrier family 13 (sodium-dependent dicarboxylate transporter), member 2/3/5
MSSSAKNLVAVAVLMAIWWVGEGTSLAITALLPIVLFPLFGIMPGGDVAFNYANQLAFLFLGGFMIALAMERWNLHKRIALHIINKVGTSPERIVLGFMASCGFLSMWISNTAATMMMLPVGMAVVHQFASQALFNGKRDQETETKVYQSLGLVLMLGLAYSASIGGVGTLIGTPPNIILAGLYNQLYPEYEEISFFKWMLTALPLVIVFLPLVWFYLCRFVSPFPLSQIEMKDGGGEIIRRELNSLGPMNPAEKTIAIVFASTAFLWIFRQPISLGDFEIPGWSNLLANPKWAHDATVAMAMGILLMILPANLSKGMTLEGQREYFILDWETIQHKTPWGILFLFGGGFALANGFSKTGLDLWVTTQFHTINDLPIGWTILILCLGVAFLSELTSNTATATLILPVIGAIAVSAHFHPLELMIPAALSSSFAFMLPVATPPNAIVFGSGWLKIPQMTRAGLALNILGAILVTTLTLTLARSLLIH